MPVTIRRATQVDVGPIVALLADDPLGATRERPGDPAYLEAFEAIDSDPHQLLVVAVDDDEVVGTLQLTFTRGLSRRGLTRAIGEARARGCGLVQLTTDASRADAHRFYERLGFEASHVGMKLSLR